MRNVLLVRYGEVFLKGANRPHFLKVLNDNVKKAVKPIGEMCIRDRAMSMRRCLRWIF